MLKIGEFSRLSQVTVKTLHHYDEIGLLVPAHIDHFTNHRYYSVEQLPQIHRIMALKGLGLSLEQIGLMLNERLDAQQLRGMLRLKQGEIQQRLREEQTQLAQVEFRLRMLEMEENMPELEVVVKEIAPMRALTLRMSFTRDQVVAVNQELVQALAQHNVKLTGPETEIWYEEEFKPERAYADVEVVLPVDDRQTADVLLPTLGTLKLTTVPGLERRRLSCIGVRTRSQSTKNCSYYGAGSSPMATGWVAQTARCIIAVGLTVPILKIGFRNSSRKLCQRKTQPVQHQGSDG